MAYFWQSLAPVAGWPQQKKQFELEASYSELSRFLFYAEKTLNVAFEIIQAVYLITKRNSGTKTFDNLRVSIETNN